MLLGRKSVSFHSKKKKKHEKASFSGNIFSTGTSPLGLGLANVDAKTINKKKQENVYSVAHPSGVDITPLLISLHEYKVFKKKSTIGRQPMKSSFPIRLPNQPPNPSPPSPQLRPELPLFPPPFSSPPTPFSLHPPFYKKRNSFAIKGRLCRSFRNPRSLSGFPYSPHPPQFYVFFLF